MKFVDEKGYQSSIWAPNMLLRSDDINDVGIDTYVNFTNAVATMVKGIIGSESADVVAGGLTLTHSSDLTSTLDAGVAVSFKGRYMSGGSWGYAASVGDIFSVAVGDNHPVAFGAGGGLPRIDTVEVRPILEEYNPRTRNFRDPITGLVSATTLDIKQEYGYEFAVRIGTGAASPVAPATTAGWIKIAEVRVAASAVSITQEDIYNVDRSGYWTTAVNSTTSIAFRLDPGVFPTEGLVAYYSLDGQSLDTSGNGYHGTDTDVTYVAGEAGQAGSFNGSTSKIDTPTLPNLGTAFTISGWVNLTTYEDHINIFLSRSLPYVAVRTSKSPMFSWRDGDGTTQRNIIGTGDASAGWHHIVGTHDGTTGRLYLDGVNVGSANFSTVSVPSGAWAIGNHTTAGFEIEGLVDELRIYNRALPDAEIATLTRFPGGVGPGVVDGGWMRDASVDFTKLSADALTFPSEGLVAYYSLDDGSAKDTSGLGNHGTIVGDPAVVNGVSRKALSFDGTDDYVTASGAPSGDCTVVMHVSAAKTGIYRVLWSQNGGSRRLIDLTTGNILRFVSRRSDGATAISANIPAASWTASEFHMIVGRQEGLTLTVFLDGVEIHETSHADIYSTFLTTQALSANSDGTNKADAILDEVRIYNRALPDAEIATLNRFPGGVEPGVVDGSWLADASVDFTKLSADALTFPSEGLVAYYSLDGQSLDTSGNANHGTDTAVTYVAGKAGQAASFNGTTSKIDIPNAALSVFSVSAWLQAEGDSGTASTGFGNVIGNASANRLLTDYDSGVTRTDRMLAQLGAGNHFSDSINVPLNTWFHVVYTHDGSDSRWYVNGAASGSAFAGAVTLAANQDIGLGTYGFLGPIDEVRIYNRDLSAAEVATLTRFPGGVGPGVVDGSWLADASIREQSMAEENFIFTKSVGSANRKVPVTGDVRSYLGKDPNTSQLDADPVGISIEEYNGENYETRFKAAVRSGGGVVDLFVSGFFEAGESVLSSPGLIWTERTQPFGNSLLRMVAHGGGTLLAGGRDGKLSRSTNGGETWSSLISLGGLSQELRDAGYGDDTWILVGDSGRIQRSTDDGVTWSDWIANNFESRDIRAIAYGDGVWVAAGSSKGLARSTDNGVTWSSLLSNDFGTLPVIWSVAYGNGVWMAAADNGELSRSTDNGVTWSSLLATSHGTSRLRKVAYATGVWILIGDDGKLSRSLDDGATWSTLVSTPHGTNGLIAIAYGDRTWVIAGNSASLSRSTDNGATWGSQVYGGAQVSQPFGVNGFFMGLTYDPGVKRFAVAGYMSDTNDAIIATSDWLEAGSGIVEQGSNTNGHYVVFSSGLQVCWDRTDIGSIAITSSWGNNFISTELDGSTLPKAFASAPFQLITASGNTTSGAQALWVSGTQTPTTTNWGRYYLTRSTSNTIGVVINKLAIGYSA